MKTHVVSADRPGALAQAAAVLRAGGLVAFPTDTVYGVGAANLQNIATFVVAYMGVVLLEPLIDLAVLAAAKALRGLQGSALVQSRVYSAA